MKKNTTASDRQWLSRHSLALRAVAWGNMGIQVAFPLMVSFSPVMIARASDSTTHVMPPIKAHQGGTDDPAQAQQDDPARTTATLASQAGQFLSNNPNGDAARSLATGLATGRANQEIQSWLNHFGNARVQLNVDEHFSLKNSQFDLLHPWWENQNNLLFSQASAHRTDDRNQANLGFGWRHFNQGTPDGGLLGSGDYMLGLNSFLDYDLSRDHARLGFGVEYWRNYLKLSANDYLRLTNWKNSPDVDDYEERPANGWDIRAEGWLPAYPQLGGKLTYEQYYGNEVALFGRDNRQKDPHAFTLGVNYTPFPLLTLSAEQRQGKSGENDTRVGLEFNYQFGDTWSHQLDGGNVGAMHTLAGSRYDFIERNNNIVLEYRKKEVIAITLPERMEGKSGMQYPLNVTVSKAKYGLQDIVWDDAALVSAGGVRTCTSATACSVKMPPFHVGGNNTYTVGAVAHDKKGNASERVQMNVVVTGVGVSTSQSTVTAALDTLLADGQTQTAVTAVLKGEDGTPVTGLADQLALSGVLTPESGVVDGRTKMKRTRAAVKDVALSALKETAPGTYTGTLTAGTSAGHYALTLGYAGAALLKAQLTLQDTASDLSQAVVTTDKPQLVAGTTDVATLTVALKQKDGTPVTGEANRLAFFPTRPEVDPSRLALSAVTEDTGTPGTYTATLSSTQALAALEMGLKVNGKDSGKRVSVVVKADEANVKPLLIAQGNNIPADGTTPITLQVGTTDPYGNAVPAQSVTLAATEADVTLADATVTTDAQGAAKTTLTATLSGEKTVTAEVNGQQATVKVMVVADAATAVVKTVTADAAEKTVGDGADHAFTLSAVVQDAAGNPVPNVEVQWSHNSDTSVLLSTAKSMTDDKGTATVTLTNPDHRARADIVVSALTANTGAVTAKVTWTADAANAAVETNVLADPAITAVPADGKAKFTYLAHVADPYGNPVNNTAVKWVSTVKAATLSAAETQTDIDGNTSVTLHSIVAATNVVVSAQAGGREAIAATPVGFTADVTHAALTLTLDKDGATADNVDTVLLRVKLADPQGIAIANELFTLDLTASPEVATVDGKTDYTLDNQGEAIVALKTTKAGTHEVTVKANPGGNAVAGAIAYEFVAGPMDATKSEAFIPVAAAQEGTALDILIYPRDQYNNDIALAAIKDKLEVKGTAANGLNVVYSQTTEAAGNPVIKATTTPKVYDDDVRQNTVSVTADGNTLLQDQQLAWVPIFYQAFDVPDGRHQVYARDTIKVRPEVSEFSDRESGIPFAYSVWTGREPADPMVIGTDAYTGLDVRASEPLKKVVRPWAAMAFEREALENMVTLEPGEMREVPMSPPKTGWGPYLIAGRYAVVEVSNKTRNAVGLSLRSSNTGATTSCRGTEVTNLGVPGEYGFSEGLKYSNYVAYGFDRLTLTGRKSGGALGRSGMFGAGVRGMTVVAALETKYSTHLSFGDVRIMLVDTKSTKKFVVDGLEYFDGMQNPAPGSTLGYVPEGAKEGKQVTGGCAATVADGDQLARLVIKTTMY